MKKISVAMTTYNGERFLKEQLDSMLTQSRPVDELVVCDDGSTDGTVGILNEFSKRAPFTVNIFINEKNLGSTKNFEKAMSLCTGDIILLCDHDDVWLPNKVRVLEEIFLTNPNCAMAFTDAVIIDENNVPQGRKWYYYPWPFNPKMQRALVNGKALHLFVGGCQVTGATAAVTKRHFEECLPFPPAFIGELPPRIESNPRPLLSTGLIHDHWLAVVASIKRQLFLSPEPTINYRIHSTQQVGFEPKTSVVQRLNNVNNLEWAICVAQTTLTALEERFGLTPEQRSAFMDKINFLLLRKNLPSCRFKRTMKIFPALIAGKYHTYSTGFLSAAKDLVIKI